MIKSNLFPDKEFSSTKELVDYVKSNIQQIIDLKKVEQKSCDKGQALKCKVLNGIKMMDAEKAIMTDNDYWYIAVNSTYILDSHDDLHDNGIWDKTIEYQQGKNYLVDTHVLSIDTTIVKKEHIEMFVASVSFKSLGLPYNGNTQVLVYKFRKDKVIHQKAKEWLESGDEIQASVRMQYVTIEFALDSNDPDDADWKKNYDRYIGKIANKEDFDYIPYFFIITEAKNTRESSLVLFGSNPVTGNNIKEIEQSEDTHKNDNKTHPLQSNEQKKSNFYSLIH